MKMQDDVKKMFPAKVILDGRTFKLRDFEAIKKETLGTFAGSLVLIYDEELAVKTPEAAKKETLEKAKAAVTGEGRPGMVKCPKCGMWYSKEFEKCPNCAAQEMKI